VIPERTDVLIVGAGPTGLALSIGLQQAGIDHVIVDRLTEAPNTSRAAVVHAHTLEVLESIGVAGDLTARGLLVERFSIRDRGRPLLQVGFERLPSAYPYLLMLPQDVTETVLRERLVRAGGSIERGVTVTGVVAEAGRARATVESTDGVQTIEARYVVGADGVQSVVREAAGIRFDGETYPHSFVLADVRMDWPYRQQEVSLFFSPAGLLVVAPLPGGAYRVVATLDPAPEQPAADDIQRLIDARGPAAQRARVIEVIWGSRFRVHHRLADAYRRGPMLLMGDAAHVHSPAGGQGMNTGLVDAVVLSRILADVLRGARPAAALDEYERLRRPAARQVLGMVGRLTAMATARHAASQAVRNAVLSAINRLPPARRQVVMNLSGLSRSALAQLSRA
jgi:2-polyprenyl-6-methoxyphenol hydroxylase-like FAD-dependent oxidoreductase